MPPDLDDLINSIREEASRESALDSVYEGTRQDDLVDEEIDERILNLLGLDDTFDIDYKTYMTLLKERIAARMAKSQIPTEESEIITEEFRRVKRKTGRFKIKTKKISVQDFQKSVVKPSKLLTGSTFNTPTEEPKAEEGTKKEKSR